MRKPRIAIVRCTRCGSYYCKKAGHEFKGFEELMVKERKRSFEGQGFSVMVIRSFEGNRKCPTCVGELADIREGRESVSLPSNRSSEDGGGSWDNAVKAIEGD